MSQVIGMEEALKLFDMQLVHRAMATALNQGATKAKTVTAKAVGEVYNVKRAAVKRTILVKKASPQRRSGALISISKQLPLIDFKAKQDASGVGFEIKRGRRKHLPSAFIGPISKVHRSGKRKIGAAIRRPGVPMLNPPRIKRGPRKGQPVKRDRIWLLMGVSIAHLTDNDEVIADTISELQLVVPKLFDKAIRKVIDKEIIRRSKASR